MPLIKSKSEKAFKHNLKAEIHAGKPQKQALAIAYATKRAAKKAGGGHMSTDPNDYDSDEDYYNALKSKGLKRPPAYTNEAREAIISGKTAWHKEHAEKEAKRKADDQAFYAKNAPKSAEYNKRILASVNETRKRAGMPLLDKLKSGGKAKKSNSCW